MTEKKRGPEYVVWLSMRQRCNDPNHKNFKNYGALGITVCNEWTHSFETFLRDMGEKPFPRASIDRIDTLLGYFPENCKWSTHKEQQNNKRDNKRIAIDGVIHTVAQVSARYGVPERTVFNRLKAMGQRVDLAKLTSKRYLHKPASL